MRQISAITSLNFGGFGAVTEQLAGAARRCNSEAKAKGRKEQLEETEEQDRLGVLQAEKAEALIRELRQQNAKGEEYFEREKEELQSQLVRHRITAVETSLMA